MNFGKNACSLIRAFLTGGINQILYSSPLTNLIKGGLFSLGLLFFYGLYLFFLRVFKLVYLQGEIGFILTDRLFSILFLMILSLLVFSSMLSSLSVLFTSREPEMLVYLPVKPFDRYLYLTLKNTVISSWYIIILGYPIFISYGVVYGQPPGFFLLSFLIVTAFAFISSNIGISITTFIVRILPTRRIRQIFLLIGLFSVVYIVTFFRVSRPERLYSSIGIYDFLMMLQNAKIPQNKYFPNDIASETISKYEFMDPGTLSFNILKLSIYLLVFFIAGYLVHFFFYKKSFIKFSVTKAAKSRYISKIGFSRLKGSVSVLFKDMIQFTREVEQWSQIFILLSLVIIYIINLKNIPIVSPAIKDAIVFLNISFIGFIIAAVTLRFGFPLYSLEGKYRWVLIKSAVSKRQIFLAKLYFSLIPSMVMSAILTIISNIFLEVEAPIILYMLFLNAITAFVISLVGTSLGIIFPKFETDNPMQIAMSIGGLLFMVSSMLYVFLVNYLAIRPFSRYYRMIPEIQLFLANRGYTKSYFIYYNILILIISIIISLFFYQQAVRRPLK